MKQDLNCMKIFCYYKLALKTLSLYRMSAWAEVRQLQEELYNVQLEATKNKLSERNCVAVIQRLINLGWLEVVYSCDGKEYITPKQLEKDILDELYVCGGRVAMTDLAQTLNVDYSHVEKKVNELLSHDTKLSIHYGELISKQFFDNLAIEINETLQETGLLPLTQLSREVSLPVSTLAKELVPRVGDLIIGTYDKKTDTLFTTAFVDRQAAKLRGACSAATRPVHLGKIMEVHGITASLGHGCVKDMISSGRLRGQLQGHSTNPVFIPSLYTSAQNQWADSFYKQNGYITFEMMQNKGIDNPHSAIARFVDSVSLSSGCVSEGGIAGVQSIVEEAVATDTYIELIDWMFDWCNEADEEEVLGLVLANSTADLYRILPSKAVVSVTLLNKLLSSFDSKIAEQVKSDAVNPKILATFKKFDNAAASAEIKTVKKAKGGKKGKKGRARDDDDEEFTPPKPVLGPTYLSAQQIEDDIKDMQFFMDNEPKEDTTLAEISELLKKELNDKYCKALDEEVRKKTMKSSKSQQKADEDTINILYNTVILCEKGLKVFEDPTIRAQIEKHLLKTLCMELTKATFSKLAEETGCPFQGDNLKLDSIVGYLPKNAKQFATSIITSVTSGTDVEEFIQSYTELTDPQFTQLLVRKLDKKKERNMVFTKKQALLEQLKTEQNSADLLNISCNLIFIKQHSTLLHVPGRCISSVVKLISRDFTGPQLETINRSLSSVVTELKGEGAMSEGDKQALRDLVSEILFGKQVNEVTEL